MRTNCFSVDEQWERKILICDIDTPEPFPKYLVSKCLFRGVGIWIFNKIFLSFSLSND